MLIKKSKIPFRQLATIGILPSFLKKLIYRLKGYSIGKNVSIGFGSVIIGKRVRIGDHVKIGLITIIRGEEILVERYAAIGSFTVIDTGKIRIGEDARINEQVIIGGMKTPDSAINLGKRTIVMEYAFINTTRPVTIGDDTGIGGHCLLFTHGSWLNEMEGFPVTFAPINIGKSVWLPWRVFVMPGVTIGDKVVIGANSLISKSVASHSLVAGSPAKILKENYPAAITAQQRKDLFYGYLGDFIKFLSYHGIAISKTESELFFLLRDENGPKRFEIRVLFNAGEMPVIKNVDNLIAINVQDEQMLLPGSAPRRTMMLDIWRKQRLGTSDVGEEFIKFLGRYGMRFERLD